MAITLVGTGENSVIGGTSLSVTLPTLAAGDVVYVFMFERGVSGPPDPSITSGYTPLYNNAGVGSTYRNACWRKVMGGTPDTTFDLSWGASVNAAAIAVCLRGVDNTTPEDATTTVSAYTATSGAQPNSPSITTVTNNAWVISSVGFGFGDTAITPPSGYTIREENAITSSNTLTVAAASKEITTAGAEDPGAWSDFAATAQWQAASIAVRPAAQSALAFNMPMLGM